MDNQQESLDIKNKAWLAGIWDGEGTFTIRLHREKNLTTKLCPVCTVVNTDMQIIDEIERILKFYNIAYWISEYKQTKNWKATKQIQITGLKRAERFLNFIKDYLIGKREEAELLEMFCKRRLDLYNSVRNHKNPYTEEDFEIYKKIKSLHGHQNEANKNISEILRDYTLKSKKDKI